MAVEARGQLCRCSSSSMTKTDLRTEALGAMERAEQSDSHGRQTEVAAQSELDPSSSCCVHEVVVK